MKYLLSEKERGAGYDDDPNTNCTSRNLYDARIEELRGCSIMISILIRKSEE